MFHSARFKLTAWYLLIIMLVSLIFSIIIYLNLIAEVERFERQQRVLIEERMEQQWPAPFHLPSPIANRELIEETQRRILITLLLLNGSILVLSGILGYWLAGRTLQPIKVMIDEQNRFVSDASHELKTPLTSLRSAFEVFLRGKMQNLEEAKEIIRESLLEVNKLETLSESLLELSQYQTTRVKKYFTSLLLSSVVKEVQRKTYPLAKNKKITMKFNFSETTIWGEKHSLVELFVILLDNAIKYSDEGGVVEVTSQKIRHGILVKIKDNGIGISSQDLPFIFDRFYRADAARSKKTASGYGLGLSIAKKIVALHNGVIKVQSAQKKGTMFSVYLPTVT